MKPFWSKFLIWFEISVQIESRTYKNFFKYGEWYNLKHMLYIERLKKPLTSDYISYKTCQTRKKTLLFHTLLYLWLNICFNLAIKINWTGILVHNCLSCDTISMNTVFVMPAVKIRAITRWPQELPCRQSHEKGTVALPGTTCPHWGRD